MVRLQDSNLSLQAAELRSFWLMLKSVVPPWSTPQIRSVAGTHTRAELNIVQRFGMLWIDAEIGIPKVGSTHLQPFSASQSLPKTGRWFI